MLSHCLLPETSAYLCLLTATVPSLVRLATLETGIFACSPPIEIPLSDMAGLEQSTSPLQQTETPQLMHNAYDMVFPSE